MNVLTVNVCKAAKYIFIGKRKEVQVAFVFSCYFDGTKETEKCGLFIKIIAYKFRCNSTNPCFQLENCCMHSLI